MATRFERAVFAALGVTLAGILVVGVYSGYLDMGSGCPVSLTANDRTYCAESVSVESPPSGIGILRTMCGGGFDFEGVQFDLSFSWGGTLGDSASVGGWVNSSHLGCVEASLFGDPLGPKSVNWTSTDGSVYLQWNQPFESLVGGQYVATVLCGVDLNPWST